MHRNLPKQPGDGSDGSPPSEAWLFSQAILGKPIPRIVSPEAKARAKREELERQAQFSSRHAEELRRLQATDAEARHDRELLEWTAQISTRAEDKLRALQQKEAEAREGWRRAEQFAESLLEGNWDPSKHPHAPKGQHDGGQWVAKGGGGGGGIDDSGGPIKGLGGLPVQTVSWRAPSSAAIWKGSVIAAKGRALPTPILDWNAKYGTTISQGTVPKFQPGRFWGATLELDELNIRRLTRIGNAGKFDPATDATALGNVYNEAFHAWFWGNKSSLGWLLPTMNSQRQFGQEVERKTEEAMSECIHQVVNDLESGRPILSYDELMTLKPIDERRDALKPGHNEPGQTTWGKNVAGSEREMSEELYYATIWVLYNGNKNPAPGGGNQRAATKGFFASKFHPEWTPQQVQQFVNSKYRKN
jgi:hypothetical protein